MFLGYTNPGGSASKYCICFTVLSCCSTLQVSQIIYKSKEKVIPRAALGSRSKTSLALKVKAQRSRNNETL